MEKCEWPADDELMMKYHDEEWGVPLFDDKKIFEFMVLDGFQAGLSWRTVLHKRENFRKAFEDYDLYKILRFDSKKIEALLNDKSIIRNKLKVNAVISNAQAFLKVQEEFGNFSKYMWQFVDNKPIVNKWKKWTEIPASTKESDIMSKELKKRGFKFVGTTICYAFMQAAGMVNDHTVNCFRHKELIKLSEKLVDNG
ncbi:DNA-3-methyladenine glycosylase I [Cytophagaceae bacterium AH-315-L13]|nr:DNA-3-methyladenine glycosylase I [Cytophagaceae bacterium AH-315-L13]